MSSVFNIRNQNQFSFSDLTANLKFIDIIELGYQPNKTNSGAHSIAIGTETGINNQGTFSISIGYQAGQNNQGSNAIALGDTAGQNQQKPFALALGTTAGQNNQGTSAIAIGSSAGFTNQNIYSIAIGALSGHNDQGSNAIALGTATGQNNQGEYSIAIGAYAGQTNQGSNSIIINASGNSFNANASGLHIKPIRSADNIEFLEYNENTFEITRREYKTSFAGDFTFALFNADYGKWLLCDGRSLNVEQYPKLFSVMGYSFGGSGNVFNLPDPKGRILGAIGQGSGLTNRTLGESIGTETHTLTIDQMPAHNHTITDPGHTHIYNNTNDNFLMTGGFNFINWVPKGTFQTINTSLASTGIVINPSGGSQSHSIMNPTLFIGNLFVYTDQ